MKNKKILISSIIVCMLLVIGIGFNFLFSSANKDRVTQTNSGLEKIEQDKLNEEKEVQQEKNIEKEEVKEIDNKEKDNQEIQDKENLVAVEEKSTNKVSNSNVITNDSKTDVNESNSKPNSNINTPKKEEIKNETKEESVNSNTVDDSSNLGTTTNTPNVEEVEPQKNTVTVAISCKTTINKGIKNEAGFTHLPSNGVILGTTIVEIKEGETVFEVLEKVVRQNKIHMEYSGSGSSIYIEGIDNLYEFDCGQNSGWMYSVNGVYPNYGCGAYKLKPNDVIEFNYTCDLGADLGASRR